MGRFGVARATCVVVCLAFACGFVAAQEIVSANEPGDDGAVTLTRPNADESIIHNVLPEVQGTQTQGSGAVSTPDPESQGNFLKRLGKFYAADWTGKLPGSAAPRVVEPSRSPGRAFLSVSTGFLPRALRRCCSARVRLA